MVTVGTRLRELRKSESLSQIQLGQLANLTQAAVNRYETDKSEAPYRVLLWYARHFNVSMDYIFGITANPKGRVVTMTADEAQHFVEEKPDWNDFVEACFEPGSTLNQKLKQMILNMADEQK